MRDEMDDDEQDERDAIEVAQELDERRRCEDEALERHRVLLEEFEAEWAEFQAHCARFERFCLTHAASAAYEQR